MYEGEILIEKVTTDKIWQVLLNHFFQYSFPDMLFLTGSELKLLFQMNTNFVVISIFENNILLQLNIAK